MLLRSQVFDDYLSPPQINKAAGEEIMPVIATTLILPIAAAGYSLVYLLGGGGLFGAFVIFIIAKMLGK